MLREWSEVITSFRVIDQSNNLPSDIVNAPSVNLFKKNLDNSVYNELFDLIS